MSFFSQIIEIFSSFFAGNSPEAQQKNDLRHLENDLKQFQPPIYRNRALLPAFGEAFRILDENTASIGAILSETIFSTDSKRAQHFTDILIETGFSQKARESRTKITYDIRKDDYLRQPNAQRALESHRQELNTIMKEINTVSFQAIEKTLQSLDLLNDVCRFQYPVLMKHFDPHYTSPETSNSAKYESVNIEQLDNLLQDFYYLTANFKVTASDARALEALLFTSVGRNLTSQEMGALQVHLRKISGILTQILTPDMLLNIIRLAKNDPHFQAKSALSQKRFLEGYASKFKAQFENDTKRLISEIQDERITTETNQLFNGLPLIELSGYTQENSSNFRTAGSGSFLWILPLQIIKSFTKTYMDQRVATFLNDLVVEGYFNNAQYKSDFSEAVFAGLAVANQLEEFEKTFEKGEKNDIAVMEGYIRDSSSDASFMKSLDKMIENVNTQAKKLIQTSTTTLHTLFMYINSIIPDAKKSSPEIIANIKGFFTSSRNHENAAFLESTIPQWELFMDIMRNYAIIGEVREENK